MPTQTDPQRLLRILVGRHRKIANIAYNRLLESLNDKGFNPEINSFYRGLINDLISLLKELRETEGYNQTARFYEVLEEIDTCNGSNFKEKVEDWIKDVKTRETQHTC